ncbi:M48 family metallopeptidase [Roseateles sp. BYS78W]|uniref:M48 family metallopeptidase n=1 Tax=Pelomonas candidula TaxID=3299025 RepID=A0ABW7H610_9BURK
MDADFELPSWATALDVQPSARRQRTATLEVTGERRIVARIPAGWGAEQVAELLARHRRWLDSQHAGLARFEPRTAPRAYLSGETHRHLGSQLMLQVCRAEAGTEGVSVEGHKLVVRALASRSAAQIADLVHGWRLAQARGIFGERLQRCLQHHAFFGLAAPILRLRTMQRRWGSLSAHGVLTLHPGLTQAPLDAIDSVIQHELCHLRIRDHSPAFFALMDSVHPGWRKVRERLEQLLS